ncbi:g7908 [Coccomyxa elongata]
MRLNQAEVQDALQVLLSVSHNLQLHRSTKFLALAVFADSDLCSADLWLASAVNVSGSIRLVSDILQDTLAKLHRTGMPAFIDQELPDLCDTILEALHSKITFQGCLTRGGSLTAVSIIGAAVLLAGKPEVGSGPGVLTMLSDFGGHPPQVILAQIKIVMTSMLS